LYSIKKEDILNGLNEFNKYTSNLKEDGNLMPVVFVGHGSPMNGIEDNEFSIYWSQLARQIPLPKAVLVVSAHWLSRGTKVTAMDFPPTIHDFGGFPQALFDVQYPAPGSLEIAKETSAIIRLADVELDHDWGLDHGAWTVVRHMYPEANIPVLQLSIDHTKSPQYHYDLARELYELRKRGVLIMGSGNMVHNLRMVAWNRLSDGEYGYDWALEINDHQALINYSSISPDIDKAIPTSEHYIPLLYTLGLQGKQDEVSFFNDKAVGGSLTMTSVMLG
jgi:4,5-DOPA dioxygenase extradiol